MFESFFWFLKYSRYDPVELRGHDVQTISIDVWHVSENERHEVSESSYGQFHSDDVYIIRWRYKLVASGNEQHIRIIV